MSQDQDLHGVFADAIDNLLGPISQFLKDPEISEVLINGPDEIFVETQGKLVKTNARFDSEDNLRSALNNVAASVNRRLTDEEPRLDARLPDGSRMAAVIPPLSRQGTVASIRKFTAKNMTLKDYVQLGAATMEAAQFLDVSMFLGKNILVSGGTGSGKTTLLGILCSRIPKGQRIIVIEDSSELVIHYEHVVRFETRMPDTEGKGEITMRDLVKSSLRLRPDRIILGEVRGSEALELINAMNTGHKGCLGTIHANSPQDALMRLQSLAQNSADAKSSENSLRYQIASALDLVVQISRLPDGTRRITKISEILGEDESGYQSQAIFALDRLRKNRDGIFEGTLRPQGILPSFYDEIVDNQLPLPTTHFQQLGGPEPTRTNRS